MGRVGMYLRMCGILAPKMFNSACERRYQTNVLLRKQTSNYVFFSIYLYISIHNGRLLSDVKMGW